MARKLNYTKVTPARPPRRRARTWGQTMRDMWLVLAAAALLPPVAVAGSRIWNQHGEHPAPLASSTDSEQADFATCGATRQTCVVDGDTFWYHGAKIRIADINTPEVSEPACAAEAELGARATERLVELLNQGPFTLEPIDRDTDRYGRLLRVVTRGGESLGDVLVDEGLAETWKGRRGSWC